MMVSNFFQWTRDDFFVKMRERNALLENAAAEWKPDCSIEVTEITLADIYSAYFDEFF